MNVDLEANSATALIWKKEFTLQNVPQFPDMPPIELNFPSGSIFNSESELLLCYDGQQGTHCAIKHLDVIFDDRGAIYGARSVLYGIHRSFIFYFIKII